MKVYHFMSMKKNAHPHSGMFISDRRWFLPFLASLLMSITLLLGSIFGLFHSHHRQSAQPHDVLQFKRSQDASDYFIESQIKRLSIIDGAFINKVPRLAYLISGTKGDTQRMLRVLQAVYHPRNQYILHLDLEASPRERLNLTMSIKGDPTYQEVQNVRVMAQSNLVTYKGPTMIASTLQAIAIMLKESRDWDWFINLSASDYPLVTQDELLHVFSNLSTNLNFVEHMRLVGWKLDQRAKSVILDPGLYSTKKTSLSLTTQRRTIPTSFKLFTGSAWTMLTRSFLEYCIWGWDNLPRTILMYYANFVSSPEGYFHTVICNSKEYRETTVNHDLHYIKWDVPPKQHPAPLTIHDYDKMVKSGAPFARKFARNDPVLDKIDKELLGRKNRFAHGAWCLGSSENGHDPCSLRGNASIFRPGPGAERVQELFRKVLSEESRMKNCV